MPVSKNTWIKGLNSDLSKLKSQQDSYLDAKNIRVITDEGSSTFAIENIRGNKYDFKLPPVEGTWFITLISGQTGTGSFFFERSGVQVYFVIDNVETKSYEIIVSELNQQLLTFPFPFPGNSQFVSDGSIVWISKNPIWVLHPNLTKVVASVLPAPQVASHT
jgi:hypothetical protein